MIKVLYIIDTLEVGGAESSLLTITSGFQNVIPIFVYIYPGGTLEKKFKAKGIMVYSLNVPKEYNFKEALKLLIPLVKKVQPHIIHSTLFKSDIISRRLKKHYYVPLINSLVNNSYIQDRYNNLPFLDKIKLYIIQQYDAYTSKNVDLFISNSEAIKTTNAKALKINNKKIRVIHRGRDPEIFNAGLGNNLEALSNELDIRGRKVILNVSRLLERKGQLDLLKAFKNVAEKRKDLILLIAGEGNFRPVLQSYILENNLQNKVQLLGNRADIPNLLKLADLFAFPSWYEGLPGALIEAMMSNTPIIASNIPENLECLDSESALIYNKACVESLTNALNWALLNYHEMKMKSGRALEISKKFEISSIIRQYELTYHELLELPYNSLNSQKFENSSPYT